MQNRLHAHHSALWILSLVLGLLVFTVGCGSNPAAVFSGATPTWPPISPTAAQAQLTPETLATPTEVPTKVAFAVTATHTPSAVQPTQIAATPVPKPIVAATGRIAYTVVTGSEPKFHTVWVANANGSNPHQIFDHAQWPAFSPDGSRVAYYGRPEGGSEGLYIANADGSGAAQAVIGPGVCCTSWSRDGLWVVYANSPKASQPGGPLAMVKVDGVYKTISNLGADGNGPSFSPDGKQIVFSGCLPNTNNCGLMVIPSTGGTPRVVTKDNGGNSDWSPRGDKIVYQGNDDIGHRQIFVINPDGSGKKQLTNGKSNEGQPVWSRDGGTIFWRSDQNGTAWAIYAMNADGTNQRRLIDNVPPEPDLWGWESLSVLP